MSANSELVRQQMKDLEIAALKQQVDTHIIFLNQLEQTNAELRQQVAELQVALKDATSQSHITASSGHNDSSLGVCRHRICRATRAALAASKGKQGQ